MAVLDSVYEGVCLAVTECLHHISGAALAGACTSTYINLLDKKNYIHPWDQ